ncbi:hypothetical protein RMATCC62417_00138 [Rhizopus microsporus]|nr:hypothetical protein RMATCC62417_00138 [Rhizopus microsporus]
MQDTLWCCQERIISKKVWKTINYETCTLEELSKFISKRGIVLLSDILDFLVEIKRHKSYNLMDAYHLGEAMGKATLGPGNCDSIMAEKANHFLTRMIIERSQQRPMTKSEATRAKAKSYHRIIQAIQRRNYDCMDVVQGALYAMMENAYETETESTQEIYVSIFNQTLEEATMSPILIRLLKHKVEDDETYSLNEALKRNDAIEAQIRSAFDDFVPLIQKRIEVHRKQIYYTEKPNQVKSMMKKVIKMAPLHGHNKMLSAFQ